MILLGAGAVQERGHRVPVGEGYALRDQARGRLRGHERRRAKGLCLWD